MDDKGLKLRILERDDFRCVRCGSNCGNVHHILPKDIYPEFKKMPENLVSICDDCHWFIHGQYGTPIEPTIEYFLYRFNLALTLDMQIIC